MGMMTETAILYSAYRSTEAQHEKKADNKLGKERLRLYKKLNIALQS